MNVRERFAENLVRLRKEADLSQHDLSVLVSMHRTEISLLERGKRMPRLDTMIRLAEAVESSVADLAEGIEWLPYENGGGEYRESI